VTHWVTARPKPPLHTGTSVGIAERLTRPLTVRQLGWHGRGQGFESPKLHPKLHQSQHGFEQAERIVRTPPSQL
jgi:hypothetical protein